MRIIKWIGGIFIALILILSVGAMALPKEIDMKRQISINAPAELVFSQVNDLRAFSTWSPWADDDPSLSNTFGPIEIGEGASMSWTSDKMGSGVMTITSASPHDHIDVNLDFGEMGDAKSYWNFSENSDVTEATWGMRTEIDEGFFSGWIALFVKTATASAYEEGLEKLKSRVEAGS